MTKRTLSVVIPAYNAAADIGGTLEALAAALERAPGFDAEVVLVDDGSTDGTAEAAVAAWRGTAPLRVLAQPNSGRFLARVAGLERATGEWVLLLDTRVSLHADALAHLAERTAAGERVWNGHVYLRTDDNPYGAFWKVLVEIAWKDYLADPRATSFGVDDFDRYPKGTGCFFAPRALLLDSVAAFRSRYRSLHLVSDDTALIRWIAEREPIHLSPSFACDYQPRTTLAAFLRQALYRGTTFVDGHLRRESRFFPGAVAFYPVSALLGVAVLRRPALAPAAAVVAGATAGAVAAASGCSAFESRSVAWLSPVYAVAHGAGMWRGLGMLVAGKLRSDTGL
jgi:glycosyltransferase involved in cell wall biosynthesis